MIKKQVVAIFFASLFILGGCASVPMAPESEDMAKKEFNSPASDKSGIYVFRNSNFGAALKKSLYIDGKMIGETGPMTYFFREVQAGKHQLSTESEFSNNGLEIDTEGGKNYFVRQFIKFGLVVGGANLEQVSEEEGKKGVLECKLAK